MKTDQHVNSTFNPMLLPVSFMLPYKDFQNQTKKSTNLHAKIGPGSKRHKLYGQSKSKIRKILLTVVDGIFHSSSNSLHLGLLFGGLLLLGSKLSFILSSNTPLSIYCSWNLLSIHLCFVGGLVATEKLWKLFFASTSVEWDQGQVPRINSKFDNSGANEYTISEWFSFLMAEKFGNGDWLWPVTVFQPNLKYLHVKTTLSNVLYLTY